MQRCWELEPKGRPSFSDLVSQSLESMAGYMDVGAFGQLQLQPASASNSVKNEKPEDYNFTKKECKTEETEKVKLETFCVSETSI